MLIIKKKIWPEYFEAIVAGKKKFELRLNDFEIGEGDTLLLEEWDPSIKKYTGRTIQRRVTYVLKFKTDKLFWPESEIKKGVCKLFLWTKNFVSAFRPTPASTRRSAAQRAVSLIPLPSPAKLGSAPRSPSPPAGGSGTMPAPPSLKLRRTSRRRNCGTKLGVRASAETEYTF